MSKKFLGGVVAFAAFIGIFLFAVVFRTLNDEQKVQKIETEAAVSLPEFIPTNGGRLEISTVAVTQAFRSKDGKEFYGIDLGTTISDIRVKVLYRYYIALEKQWPIKISQDRKFVTVNTTAVLPTLPVSFDTRTVEKSTENGWARFNKDDNLKQLERSITPKLEVGAHKLIPLAANAGRSVVEGFVKTWILQNSNLSKDVEVKVIFPSDSEKK